MLRGKENGLLDCLVFCTYSPCTNCANIILDAGIVQAVFYDTLTKHDQRGVEFLEAAMPVFTREDVVRLKGCIINQTQLSERDRVLYDFLNAVQPHS